MPYPSSLEVKFESKLSSEMTSLSDSRSNSKVRSEIETPHGPVKRDEIARKDSLQLERRDTLQSLRSLSVAVDHDIPQGTPNWPGDWRAYVCLIGGFLLMFNSWGLVNTYGTYQSYYMQHLLPGRDLSQLNLIGTTQSFIVLASSFVVGRLLDAGYIRYLLITGTIFVSIGTFTLSLCAGGGHRGQGNFGLIWLTQGLISGLGMACFFVSSSQVVATWFVAKKGLAVGIVASGASIAGLVYPMMTKFLISEIGFNNAVRCIAAAVTCTAALAIFLARPNPVHGPNPPQAGWASFDTYIDKSAFRNPCFLWFSAAISVLFFGFYAVFFNLEEWAAASGLGIKDRTPDGVDIGVPNEVHDDAIRTFWLLSIMNASSTLGRLCSAYLCDHYGALNVHSTVTLVASLLVLILWPLTSTVKMAIAFVVVFGIFSGAVIGLPPASMADILGKYDADAQKKLGQWTGMMYSTAAVFALTGPVIAGHLISEYKTYITVQMWSGTCLLLSSVFMAIALWEKKKMEKKLLQGEQGREESTSSSGSSFMMKSMDKPGQQV